MSNVEIITKLRTQTGAGMMDCKKALDEANNDYEKAISVLRKRGEAKAAKKMATRQVKAGIVYAYIHSNKTTGAMLELLCETDFVARTDDFKALAHDIGMQIVAMAPEYLSPEQVPSDVLEKERDIYRAQLKKEGKPEDMIEKILEGKMNKFYQEVCLLNQDFIKDDKLTINDVLKQVIAKTGEKMEIGNFSRYEL